MAAKKKAKKKTGAKKSARPKKAVRKSMARKPARKSAARKSARKAASKKPARRAAPAKRKSPMQRVKSVAQQVAHQAQVAVTGGVEALREIGGNIAERVGGQD
jgi:hypothetical protein